MARRTSTEQSGAGARAGRPRSSREAERRERGEGGERGRAAERPWNIPRSGWRDVFVRVKGELARDNTSLTAAGVAFYALLAIVPALAALVAIYGLVADPAQVEQQIDAMAGVVPSAVQDVLGSQLRRLSQQSAGSLSLAMAAGLVVSLVSAMKGVKALITSMNIAYDEEEQRGFLRLNAVALGLTVAGIVIGVLVLALVAVLPAVLGVVGLQGWTETLISLVRWPVLLGVALLALMALYRYGPSRDRPRWSWVTPGALAGTVIWVLGSALFSIYVSNFGSYNETYGSLGVVVILLLWLWVSAYCVLLGAELNAELEHQTRRDTTAGAPEPLGARGAHVADHVGKSP